MGLYSVQWEDDGRTIWVTCDSMQNLKTKALNMFEILADVDDVQVYLNNLSLLTHKRVELG